MNTKDRILDAAERLFAAQGFANTSLRAITAEAGANLASVNYYFQSKEALLQAVFERRLEPINRRRLEMLDEAEARAAGRPAPLEEVLRAIISPVVRMDASAFRPLFGRLFLEPGDTAADIVREQFGQIRDRFLAAFRRALPDLPLEDLAFRVFFMIGALGHSTGARHILGAIAQGACNPEDIDGLERRLIDFIAAGMRAPVGEVRYAG